MNILLLSLTLASTLVLHSGDRIVTDGPVKVSDGVLTFRAGGTLYTMPASEVDRIEGAESEKTAAPAAIAQPAPKKSETPRLRVSEEERKRLLAELERNHTGSPAPPQPILQTASLPTAAEERQSARDEAQWRRESRRYQEAVLRAQEELALLQSRIEELQSKIFSLVSLGYKPSQFTYDTTQLVRAKEQIPYAELEVTRAQRAWDQFRDDARREGIAPGWLR